MPAGQFMSLSLRNETLYPVYWSINDAPVRMRNAACFCGLEVRVIHIPIHQFSNFYLVVSSTKLIRFLFFWILQGFSGFSGKPGQPGLDGPKVRKINIERCYYCCFPISYRSNPGCISCFIHLQSRIRLLHKTTNSIRLF